MMQTIATITVATCYAGCINSSKHKATVSCLFVSVVGECLIPSVWRSIFFLLLLPRHSLSIERKCYWNKPVAYPACQSVCPESVLWQNGWMDQWGRSRYGCIIWEWWSSKGKGSFGVERVASHWNQRELCCVVVTLLHSCARAMRSSQITSGGLVLNTIRNSKDTEKKCDSSNNREDNPQTAHSARR